MSTEALKPADGQDFHELAPEQQEAFKAAMARAGISAEILERGVSECPPATTEAVSHAG